MLTRRRFKIVEIRTNSANNQSAPSVTHAISGEQSNRTGNRRRFSARTLQTSKSTISQNELDQIKLKPETDSSGEYSKSLRDRIDDLKNRIEKRTAGTETSYYAELAEQKIGERGIAKIGNEWPPAASGVPYMIEPPDILQIDPVQLVPKKPFRIAPFDQSQNRGRPDDHKTR